MRAALDPPSPRTRHARSLFAELPATYDRVGGLLSFGQDPRWRRFMVSRVRVPPGGRVLDVATGTAAVAIELARGAGGVEVVGLDQSEPMLRRGRARVGQEGMGSTVRFVLGQAERLPFPDAAFDALTFTYLLRYVDRPAATLVELARVIRPGGTMAGLEFHVPPHDAARGLWWLYTRGVMPAAGRLVSRSWYDVGRFLGPSISSFYRRHPLDEQVRMWRRAGFDDVRVRTLTLGGAVVVWGVRRPAEGGADGR